MRTTYIVTGYMRSGTSMMMRALEAGGLSAVRSDERDKMNQTFGDEHYKPNPNGFYELPTSEVNAIGFPKKYEGKLVKVMYAHILQMAVLNYKIVLMLRDPEEIRQSYEAFFNAHAPQIKSYNEMMELIVSLLLNRRDVDLTVLNYKDVVETPLATFDILAKKGWPIDPAAAAAIVDPDLYRFRKDKLTIGI